MIRIKFIKDHKQYRKGDIESVTRNEAFGLIDSGKAIISKDMTEADTTVTQVKPFKNRKRFTVKEK